MKKIIKVGEHYKANGEFNGYRKFIYGKMFYFGLSTPRREAEQSAAELIDMADAMNTAGSDRVTIVNALTLKQRGEEAPATVISSPSAKPVDASVTPKKTSGSMMLHAATEAFCQIVETKQVSEHTRWFTDFSMKMIRQHCKDLPLDQIGFDELTQIVATFTARPIAKKSGKPISVGTVRTILGHLRDLFNYLADSGKWEECRRFERLFRLKEKAIMSQKEKQKQAEGVVTFTVDELAKLYAEANDQQKLYMLIGLNCAATNFDLATLQNEQVVNGGTQIKRQRNKTDVLGVYDLWPMTQRLLAARMKATPKNDEGYALLTRDEKPLVYYGITKKGRKMRVDSVLQTWSKLLRRVRGEVRPMSFKVLRKTGSQLCLDMAEELGLPGLEVAQLHLSHAPRSVAEKHYLNNRNFDKLSKTLAAVWEKKLEPAFTKAEAGLAEKKKAKKPQMQMV